MFDNEYLFRGSHAVKVKKLTTQFDEKSVFKLFNRNIDIYIIAPIIGFLYGRQADIDKTNDGTAHIMGDRVMKSAEELKYNYRLIMILDSKYETNSKERIDKAFKYIGTEKAAADEELFERYVRGGIDVLYEKLIETASSSDDYINNLYDFMEDFDKKFNSTISVDNIEDLCKLARS